MTNLDSWLTVKEKKIEKKPQPLPKGAVRCDKEGCDRKADFRIDGLNLCVKHFEHHQYEREEMTSDWDFL